MHFCNCIFLELKFFFCLFNIVLVLHSVAFQSKVVSLLLGRFQVHYRVHSPGKVKRASSFKRKSCPVAEVDSKLRRKTSDVGCTHDIGMANKENELTCSDDIQRNCGLPVTSGEVSKMAGASSKYSDFTEVRAERSLHHEAFSWIQMFRLGFLTYTLIFSYQRTMKRWLTSFLEGTFD